MVKLINQLFQLNLFFFSTFTVKNSFKKSFGLVWIFEAGSCYVAPAGLKFMILLSQLLGIIGTCHQTQSQIQILK